jgi:putative hemolysin
MTVSFLLLAVLLVMSAFFSSAETALFSLNSLQIRHMKKRHARAAHRIEALMAKPPPVLSTILIGNTLVNVFASVLGFSIAERMAPGYGEAIAVPVMTMLLLTLGEIAPKRVAMMHAERMALLYEPLLQTLIRLTTPLRAVLESITRFLRRYLPGRPRGLTEDEFRTVVEVGEEEGILDEEEKTMVEGIIELEETIAREIMTPRVDVIGLDLDDPVSRHKEIARSVIYRYLPIYRGSLDHPEGFLDVPKFLLSGSDDLAQAKIPSFFVPETAPLDTLLRTFQHEHRRVAFVADEFGGTAGLITRGDILEEIVPNVENELGEPQLTIQQVRENAWLIDGSTSLEDINDELDTELDAESVDRISGWVADQAERIPRTGDIVEAQGCRVTVQRARRNRVMLVLLEKLPQAEVPSTHD